MKRGLALAAIMVSLLIGLSTGYTITMLQYKPQLENANNEVAALKEKNQALNNKTILLAKQKAELEAKLEKANNTILLLENKIIYYKNLAEKLNETISELEKENTRLASNNTLLQARIASLRAQLENTTLELEMLQARLNKTLQEVASLKAELARKNSEISTLESKIDLLESQLNTTMEELNLTREELSLAQEELSNIYNMSDTVLGWYMLLPWNESLSFFENILSQATNVAKNYAGSLLGGLSSTSKRAFMVFYNASLYLWYDYDNYVRILDARSGSIRVWNNYVQLPNETMETGGDCEDLAVYVYSMLEAAPLKGEHAYIIMWFPYFGPGHAAVLVVSKDGYYIVDPAGAWLNGISIYIELNMTDKYGFTWPQYLYAISLQRDVKEFLIDSGASVVYYDPSTDNYTYNIVLPQPYKSARELLEDWIVNWWHVNVKEIDIVNATTYKVFNSIDDAAVWIQLQK